MPTRHFGYLAISVLLLSLAATAQSIYTSPDNRFTLQVPAGWQIEPEPNLSLVTFRNGAISVAVLVSQQHKSNAMTATQFIDSDMDELKGQCPTFRNRQKGSATVAGYSAVTSISTCSDARSPAVAEDFATLTPDNLLVGFTVISPLSRYYDMLPVLEDMRTSLHIIGHPAPAAPKLTKSQAAIVLEKACLVGAFSQEDCARRQGMQIDMENPNSKTHFPNLYRDPVGRFSIEYPSGWKAISEGDNGVSGVQLRSGVYWINLMPETAASPSELVLREEQQMAARINSSRVPPFGSVGLVQLFGHGLEITFDNFPGSSSTGEPIDSYIAGVGDITGSSRNMLLIVASLPKTSPKPSDETVVPFFAIAQSIHIGKEASPAVHVQ